MGTATVPSSPHQNHTDSKSSSSFSSFKVNTNFPIHFQDFFGKLSEEDEGNDENHMNILEDKQLLPPEILNEPFRRRVCDGQWSMNRKSLCKKNKELLNQGSAKLRSRIAQQISQPTLSPGCSSSLLTMGTRRRSSSIAVPRIPPDLNRFLQAEEQKRVQRKSKFNLENTHSLSRPVSPRPSRHSPLLEEQSYSRNRTASMPVVASRSRPMLAQTKRCDDGLEYYRLRSFSITPNGIFNLGDSFKSRRSLSINSVNSSESSHTEPHLSERHRLFSNTSQSSVGLEEDINVVPTFKVAMLGGPGVGKTSLTYQFTTSEYICAYDTSLDDEFGQKKVFVMLDERETELEIIDHPASEMSVETFCSTYNPDIFVVVYSIVERKSMKTAEEILLYLRKSDFKTFKGIILVGNKSDLERKREVPTAIGRKLANICGCKFIETSSGLDHNVDELLVGILAQVRLNSKRKSNMWKRKKLSKGKKLLQSFFKLKRKSKSCENLLIL